MHAVPQHQVQFLGRGRLGEEHSQQRLETAYALFHIRCKKPRYEAENFRSENRCRLVAAKLRHSTDKGEAADAILAIMPEVVEDDKWPIRPATEERLIKAQSLYGCVDVIGPQS